MKKRLICIATGALCLAVSWAGEDMSKKMVSVIEEPIPERSALPPGAVTFGGRISEHLADAYVDFLIPVWRGGSDVLFFNPRVLGDDDSREKYSFGLGWRHLFPEQEIIIGANAYYDYLDSPYDNHYDQLGLGVEFLSRWFDARFNYYIPDGDEHMVDRSASEDFSLSDAYARGNAIYQDFKFTREITELYEGALEGFYAEAGFLVPGLDKYAELRFFGGYYNYDGPVGSNIEGWKARAELKVLPAITLDVEYYDDDKLMGGHWTGGARVTVPFEIGNIFRGKNPFEGISEAFRPRQRQFSERMSDMVIRSARVVTQVEERKRRKVKEGTDTLLTNVTFVDNKSEEGGDGTAEDPFDSIQEAVNDAGACDDDDDHGVHNVFVLGGQVYEENVEIGGFSMNLIGDGCGIDLGTGRPIIDGGGNTFGIFAFDAPQVTIASFEVMNAIIGIAASNVRAFDAHCNYVHDVSFAGIAAGEFDSARIYNNEIAGVVGFGGGGPPYPPAGILLAPLFAGSASPPSPPADDDDEEPTIIEVFDNEIYGVYGHGVSIISSGSRDLAASVYDNTISEVYGNGVDYVGSGYDRTVGVDVFGNAIGPVGMAGISIANLDLGGNELNVAIEGNAIGGYGFFGSGAGIQVIASGVDFETDITIAHNEVVGAGNSSADGIAVSIYGSRIGADVAINDNEILDPGQHAIAVYHSDSDSSGAGYLNLLVEGNNATGSGVPGDGLHVQTYASTADIDIDVIGNDFTDVQGDGIRIYQSSYSSASGGLGNFSAYIADNNLEASTSYSGYGQDGVEVYLARGAYGSGAQGDVTVDVMNNEVTGFDSRGIYVYHSAAPSGSAPSGTFDANVNDNTIVADTGATGILVAAEINDDTYYGGGIPHTIDILDNEMSGVADGVHVNFSARSYGSGGGGQSPLTVSIEGNDITRGNYKGTGIRFEAMGSTSYGQAFDTELTIRNNRIANESYAGIDVMVSFVESGSGPLGTFDLWVNDNTVTFNPSAGGTAIDVGVYGNQDGYGAGLTQNLWVQNNTLNMGSYGDGIAVNVIVDQSGSSSDGTTFTSWIQDNRIAGDPEFYGTGIEVYFTGSASYYNDGPFVVDHTITGNRVENLNGGDGIYIQNYVYDSGSYYAAHTFDADVSDNVINGTPFTGVTGIDINIYGPNLDASVVANNNQVRNMSGAGIRVYQSSYNSAYGSGGPSLIAQISGNVVENVDGCGIRVDANGTIYNGGQYYVDVTADDNRLENIGNHGVNIDYYVYGSSSGTLGDFTASVEGNRILGSQGGNGVHVYASGNNSGYWGTTLDADVTVADNVIENPSGGGIYVDYNAYGSGSAVGTFTADVLDNRITGAGGDGIFIGHSATFYGSSSGTAGTFDALVQGNQIVLAPGVSGTGIEIRTWASSSSSAAGWAATVDVLNNRVEEVNSGVGIQVRQDILGYGSSYSVSTFDVVVEDNVVLDPGGYDNGIEVVTISSDYREVDANIRVADNRVEGFGGDGIYIEQSGYSNDSMGTPSLIVDVTGNHIEDVGESGVYVSANGRIYGGAFYDVDVTISDNEVARAGSEGIAVSFYVAGSGTGSALASFAASITGNGLEDLDNRGIYVMASGTDYGSSGGYDATVDILGNGVNRAAGTGILIDHRAYGSSAGGTLVADVSSNEVVGVPMYANNVAGIDVQTRSSSSLGHDADITVSENRVEDYNFGNGIYVFASNSGSTSATLDANRVFDPGYDGIYIDNTGATMALSGTVNNEVQNPVNLDFEAFGPLAGTIIVNNVAVP